MDRCAFGLWKVRRGQLGERTVRRENGERTGTEGYLSWSFFGREKGRLRDERSRVGMGRVRSSWWGEEFIMDEIALKGKS